MVDFVSSSIGHTYSTNRVVTAGDTIVVDVVEGELPMVVVSDALGRLGDGMVKGCLRSSMVLV